MKHIPIIGGGLAGCEAAWQAAEQGLEVTLFEMRPSVQTGAHITSNLAELVCSNSLGSLKPDRASGLLKEELRQMNSLLIRCAEESAVPAGAALAVDRRMFSNLVTNALENHPRIHVVREEVTKIPAGPCIVASGPLTSPHLSQAILELTGQDALFFYDAIAPSLETASIDMTRAYRASRYDFENPEAGDYINCPLTLDEYNTFVEALLGAETFPLREFEQDIKTGVQAGQGKYFDGCLPVEIIARRSPKQLAHGPMRPVGLHHPATGKGSYAVVQLRQDNRSGDQVNMVGFQTNLKIAEQQRVFRLIPGLENAAFTRYGQMHRNTFIASPLLLKPTLQFREREDLFFAGQITGVEGYLGNIATGLLAGLNAARLLAGKNPVTLPPTTILGALCEYIATAPMDEFQPMKANFGILPRLPVREKRKLLRTELYAKRALADLALVLQELQGEIHA
ncbi:MAG: methylenetetrahydrofolate--tRNA-(uracil(54)-C(5))-methyltransferase (FADH(2)-oxidizing) TrmFO [Anaerolineaceae bacterium]